MENWYHTPILPAFLLAKVWGTGSLQSLLSNVLITEQDKISPQFSSYPSKFLKMEKAAMSHMELFPEVTIDGPIIQLFFCPLGDFLLSQ